MSDTNIEPHVTIVIPSQTMVHANFAVSLAAMVGFREGIRFTIANVKGTYHIMNRTHGAREAIKKNASHVLFIDSDMAFPQDALVRLLAADKDIIGTNYVQRAPPHRSLVVPKGNTAQEVSGVVEVDRLPTGFLLIKTEVFGKIEEPWFLTPWDIEAKDIQSEDYFFCDLACKHGFAIWMDVDLSLQMVHWGETGFRWSTNEQGYETVTSVKG